MSSETRPSVTRDFEHGHYDDDAERQQEKHDKKRRRNFFIGVGGVATFLAAATAAGVLALGGDKEPVEKTEPRQEPGTSAPANPGVETAAPVETAPSATAETDPTKWNEQNIPLYADLDGDGNHEAYTGVEGLAKAFELKASDYATPEEAAAAFIDRLNTFVNWGNNKEVDQTYLQSGIQSKDGQWLGTAAVFEEYVRPAFEQGVFGEPANGISIINNQQGSWLETQAELARQTGSRYVQSADNPKPYFVAYKVDESKKGVEHIGGEEAKGYYQFWIDVTVRDNIDEADLPPELGAQPVKGAYTISLPLQLQGEGEAAVWKAIGVGDK